MNSRKNGFINFIFSPNNKIYFWLAIAIGILYLIIVRIVYPVPAFFSDSYTYVGGASTGQPISIRPILYSKILIFFRLFSTDFVLLLGHYLPNLVGNLFLFFTCIYFFPSNKIQRVVLYVLLICNPLFAFYSNYVSPDALFNGFTIIWFTLLIWIMKKPKWHLILLQLIVLLFLFMLRYNAIFFPAILALALFLTSMPIIKKLGILAVTAGCILLFIFYTSHKTKEYTGTKIFSAFAGWQMANNALHILRHEKIDTNKIEDKEVKHMLRYTLQFFDTIPKHMFFPNEATAVYIWSHESPLKKYMKHFPGNKNQTFKTWNALGPIYNEAGKEIILQKPLSYVQRFVLPNTYRYFVTHLEAYNSYFGNQDRIAGVATKFFKYKSDKIPKRHPVLHTIVFQPWLYIFPFVNVFFIVLLIVYVMKKRYLQHSPLFNKTLACFTALLIINFVFIVVLAPTVLRYHFFILTLAFPFLVYLMGNKKTELVTNS